MLTRDSGLTVTRSGDTLRLSGNNGNLAPQPGSKSFSLNECIQRNGEQFIEQAVAETQEQNALHCATVYDPDGCDNQQERLPWGIAFGCTVELITNLDTNVICEGAPLLEVLGSSLAWIVFFAINACGGVAGGVVLAPGGLAFCAGGAIGEASNRPFQFHQ